MDNILKEKQKEIERLQKELEGKGVKGIGDLARKVNEKIQSLNPMIAQAEGMKEKKRKVIENGVAYLTVNGMVMIVFGNKEHGEKYFDTI